MIEGDRKGDVVDFGVSAFISYRVAIIKDVIVRKSGSFWSTCCPWGELDVGWILVVDMFRKETSIDGLGQISVIDKSFDGIVGVIKSDDWFEGGEFGRLKVERVIGLELGKDVFDDFDVIKVFELIVEE